MGRFVVLTASSWFGLGYLPKAPGTWGTLGAIPLWWALSSLSWPGFVAASVCMTGLAVWVAGAAERIYGAHDSQKIVIDEVVGLLVAAIGVPFHLPEIVATVLLFRLIDMTKPWPIAWLDREVRGGLGVVIDDVAAGVVSCGLVHLGRWLIGGPVL